MLARRVRPFLPRRTKEAVATDRAHRIDQDKPVFVHKLVATGTMEERMVQYRERRHRPEELP